MTARVVDLAEILGLERDKLRLGDREWLIRSPGELTYVERVKVARLMDAVNKAGNDPDADLEALAAQRAEVKALIMVDGKLLPAAGLDVAVSLFAPALLAMMRGIAAVGAPEKPKPTPPDSPA